MIEPQPKQRQFVLNAQYIRDLSFEAPNPPHIFANQKNPPKIAVQVDIDASRMEGNVFQVVLKIEADVKADEEQVYLAELAYAAIVTLEELPKDEARMILLIETPQLIFPFARRVLADITQDGGFQPLLLDPIDFAGLYEQNRRLEAAETGPPQ